MIPEKSLYVHITYNACMVQLSSSGFSGCAACEFMNLNLHLGKKYIRDTMYQGINFI